MPDDQTALKTSFDLLNSKITFHQDDFFSWWMEPSADMGGKPRVAVLAEAQAVAETKLPDLSPEEVDHHGAIVSGWLPLINSFTPSLRRKYKVLRGLVGEKLTMLGVEGYTYKDQVEGQEVLAQIEESMGLAERLATSISHQLDFLKSQNYRINSEIKAAIQASQVSTTRGGAGRTPQRENQRPDSQFG